MSGICAGNLWDSFLMPVLQYANYYVVTYRFTTFCSCFLGAMGLYISTIYIIGQRPVLTAALTMLNAMASTAIRTGL